MMQCDHAKPKEHFVACRLELFGGSPSYGTCKGCEQNTTKGEWPIIAITVSAPTSPSAPITPVPRDQWPSWMRDLAGERSRGDSGAGDTAGRIITSEGLEGFEKRFGYRIGPECGCWAKMWNESTQAVWNARYPYSS